MQALFPSFLLHESCAQCLHFRTRWCQEIGFSIADSAYEEEPLGSGLLTYNSAPAQNGHVALHPESQQHHQ